MSKHLAPSTWHRFWNGPRGAVLWVLYVVVVFVLVAAAMALVAVAFPVFGRDGGS